MSPVVQFERVTKNFGRLAVISKLSGKLFPGEIVSLVGPSGCGKSTLLRLVAGMDAPSGGEIRRHIEPEQIGFVFQNVRLLPWKTALQNVTFVLRDRYLATWQQDACARKALARVGLTEFHDYFPPQLSGGMQKRVAIARALSIDPQLLLFDEPFSDLDLPLRMLLIQDIHRLLKTNHKTAIYVTHDVREALMLSDRLYVLSARPAHILEVIDLTGQNIRPDQDTWLTPALATIESRIIAKLQAETQGQMS